MPRKLKINAWKVGLKKTSVDHVLIIDPEAV
jgi:hypothetical protein